MWSASELEDCGVKHHTNRQEHVYYQLDTQQIATGQMGKNRLYKLYVKLTAHVEEGPTFVASTLAECISPHMPGAATAPFLAAHIESLTPEETDFFTAY